MGNSSGLRRLGGGIAARERTAWERPCSLPSCTTGDPVAGVIETLNGPIGFCGTCCDRAEATGRSVRREPLTPRPKAVRLTPPQIELLTDLATKPQMYLRRWSRWEKTGGVLARLGLAVMSGCGPDHSEITITQAGRDEAARRGITGASSPSTADGDQDG